MTDESERILDGRWDGDGESILVEVRKTSSVRDLRDALLMALQAINKEPPGVQAACVITESRLSSARIVEELAAIRAVVRPDLRKRVHCLLHAADGSFTGAIMDKPDEFYGWLRELVTCEVVSPGERSAGAKNVFPARHAVVATLLAHRLWARDPAPLRIGVLQRMAGVSYPTVAAALKDMRDKGLLEEVGAAVRLRIAMDQELVQLAREHAALRATEYFVDPTGMETPQHLTKRLFKLQREGVIREDVRIGGVAGATHHFERLDISAPPRLDASVQGKDISFVRKLNAGLVRRSDPAQKVVLAVHPTWNPYFRDNQSNPSERVRYATPLECLADLMDLGYTREAAEMAHDMTQQIGLARV